MSIKFFFYFWNSSCFFQL